jgi:hypothetical protein
MTTTTKGPGSSLPTAVEPMDHAQPTGLVTVLQVVGRGIELRLSPEQRTFSIGSALGVDLHVSSPQPEGRAATRPWQIVSRNHAQALRKLNGLVITDQHSKNGITIMGERRPSGEIVAGQYFTLGVRDGETLVALDEHMVVLRKELQWVLGFEAHAAVDAALIAIAQPSNPHVAFLGDDGCDQDHLAREIHRASSRRNASFAALTPDGVTEADAAHQLGQLERGTAYLDLHQVKHPLPRVVMNGLVGGTVRAIASAASAEQLGHRFGARNATLFELVDAPRLVDRLPDVPRLLDTLLVRHGSQRSLNELGDAWLEGICRYRWPQNLTGLRKSVPRWLALIETGSVTAAAEQLKISHQALSDWLKHFFPKKKPPPIPTRNR